MACCLVPRQIPYIRSPHSSSCLRLSQWSPPFLGVVRLPTVCPKIPTSTGATMTSGSLDGNAYFIGISVGVGGEDEDEEESEGESNDPRERLTAAAGGRAMRKSNRPYRVSSSGVGGGAGGDSRGRRPNSDRADAKIGRLMPSLAVLPPRHFRTMG